MSGEQQEKWEVDDYYFFQVTIFINGFRQHRSVQAGLNEKAVTGTW